MNQHPAPADTESRYRPTKGTRFPTLRRTLPERVDRHQLIVWTLIAITLAVTLATAATLLVEADRGLDISDEGTYLAHAQPHSRAVGMSGFYGRYTSLLLDLAGNDAVRFRGIGMVIILVAGAAGGAGMAAMATARRTRDWAPVPIVVGCLVGMNAGLLYYFPHLLTPSYNWMAVSTVMATLGSIGWWWEAAHHQKRLAAQVAAALVGSGVFLSGMAKAPAGPAMFLAALLVAGVGAWLVSTIRPHFWLFLRTAGAALIGWLAFHLIFRSGPAESLQIIRQVQEWNILNDPDLYSISGAITAMVEFLLEAPVIAAQLSFGVALLPLIGPLLSLDPNGYHERARIYAVAVGGSIAATAFQDRWLGGGTGFFELGDISATLLVVVAAIVLSEVSVLIRSSVKRQFQPPPTTMDLCLLSLAGAIGAISIPFGSNNGPLINSSFSLGLLLTLTIILLLSAGSRGLIVAATGMALVVAVATSVVVDDGREKPYRQKATSEQTVPVDLGVPSTRFLLDPDSADYFEVMKAHASTAGFVPGTPMLDFTDFSTGTVWGLGGRTPDTVFLGFGRHPNLDAWVTEGLERLDPEVFEDSWLLTGDLNTSPNPELVSILGRRFPDDYVSVGGATWWRTGETHTLWAPKL